MKTFIVFDLDDTLFAERDYVDSAYRHIARVLEMESGFSAVAALNLMRSPGNPFDNLSSAIGKAMTVERMVEIYRTHRPDIRLDAATARTLAILRNRGTGIGLLTEGRTLTQSNKIEALGLRKYLTESPMIAMPRERGGKGKSFVDYTHNIEADNFVSVGDNPAKDFAQPNAMAWTTIAIADHGINIHSQDFGAAAPCARPQFVVDAIADLPELLSDLGVL